MPPTVKRPTAAAKDPPAPPRDWHSARLPGWAEEVLKPYKVLFFVAVRIAKLLPLIISLVLGTYFAVAVAYIAYHPGVIVTLLFAVIDCVPAYASYATKSIAEQFKIELTARLGWAV